MHICPCHSLTSSQLTLPLPLVLKSILYICVIFWWLCPNPGSRVFQTASEPQWGTCSDLALDAVSILRVSHFPCCSLTDVCVLSSLAGASVLVYFALAPPNSSTKSTWPPPRIPAWRPRLCSPLGRDAASPLFGSKSPHWGTSTLFYNFCAIFMLGFFLVVLVLFENYRYLDHPKLHHKPS